MLLRTRPGITVNELARELSISVVGVRRHLDTLVARGLVERAPALRPSGAGRPASGWRLSSEGMEEFPRRYDALALELLEDLAEEAGPDAVDAVFARRTEKLVTQYQAALDGVDEPHERIRVLATLRDDAGYLAECHAGSDGDVLLVENNCAVHRVAAQHSAVCSMELVLFRRVLGPDVEVTRVSHTMQGDPVCSYRMRPMDNGVEASGELP